MLSSVQVIIHSSTDIFIQCNWIWRFMSNTVTGETQNKVFVSFHFESLGEFLPVELSHWLRQKNKKQKTARSQVFSVRQKCSLSPHREVSLSIWVFFFQNVAIYNNNNNTSLSGVRTNTTEMYIVSVQITKGIILHLISSPLTVAVFPKLDPFRKLLLAIIYFEQKEENEVLKCRRGPKGTFPICFYVCLFLTLKSFLSSVSLSNLHTRSVFLTNCFPGKFKPWFCRSQCSCISLCLLLL